MNIVGVKTGAAMATKAGTGQWMGVKEYYATRKF